MTPLMDDLTYDIEYLRLRTLANEADGLNAWAAGVGVFRDAYFLEDCRRLLNSAKSWPLSPMGRTQVREQSALLYLHAHEWDEAERAFASLLPSYEQLGDRHGQARTFGHLGLLADLNGNPQA